MICFRLKNAFACLITFAVIAVCQYAYGQAQKDSREKQALRRAQQIVQKAEQERAGIEAEKLELLDKLSKSDSELKAIKADAGNSKKRSAAIESQIKSYKTALAKSQTRIAAGDKVIEQNRKVIEERTALYQEREKLFETKVAEMQTKFTELQDKYQQQFQERTTEFQNRILDAQDKIALTRTELEQSQRKVAELEQVKVNAEREKQQLAQTLKQETGQVQAKLSQEEKVRQICEDKNEKLHVLSLQVLDKYAKERLRGGDPFLKLKKVELENLIQGMEDQAYEAKIEK